MFLPEIAARNILEIGCGTGGFTQRLMRRYPQARFRVTDVSPEMLLCCMRKYGHAANATFAVMDGDCPAADYGFDIVASCMSLQWLDDPIESIRRQRQMLSSDGGVAYATIGPDNFPEWQETLDTLGESAGLIQMPQLPGVLFEERIQMDYGSAENFLAVLRLTGARHPRPGHRPLSASALRRACTAFNRSYSGRITWHIVYGLLGRT